MLDLDGDGNPLDDIIGVAGKAIGRSRRSCCAVARSSSPPT